MEMKINSKLIKTEREKRAWSQDHLARAAGLGIRTIQRIENTGSASLESVKALASVFDIEIERLQVNAIPTTTLNRKFNSKRIGIASIIATLMLVLGLITVRTSLAEDVKLNYAVSIEDQDDENNAVEAVRMGSELLREGQSATILVDQFRLEVTPTIQQDGVQIILAVKVYENIGGEYSLRAEPKVVTAENYAATIRSNSSTGNLLTIFLTPSIQ